MTTKPPSDASPERDASAAEMRALGHPLRWRILRLTLDRPMTNKQIAERVRRDPGTVLHHVRVLVREGFLVSDEVRAGRRGALERPYRASGKTWRIRLKPDAGNTAAILDAVREEVVEAGADSTLATLRLGVHLKPADVAELKARIVAIGNDFAARDEPNSEPVGILAVVHRRRP